MAARDTDRGFHFFLVDRRAELQVKVEREPLSPEEERELEALNVVIEAVRERLKGESCEGEK